jgi:hypothetical protein
LNLALNRHAGEWDFEALAGVLQELDLAEFDMDTLGFDEKEAQTIIAAANGDDDEDDEDEPAMSNKPKRVRCPKCGCRFTPKAEP